MNIVEASRDPKLFASIYGASSWNAWRAALAAVFGLPCTGSDAFALYQQSTGRTAWPQSPAREAWFAVGRRGGKSHVAALVAVFLAAFRDYRALLSPGERGVVMVIAADRRQARVVMRYVQALLAHPMLKPLVSAERAESVDLKTCATIEVHTASYRTVRGYTLIAAICDEVAYWRDETTAQPDVEIVNALRPALATVPGSLLLGISSPYARRGVLWRAHQRYHGKDGAPVLVWQAPTRTMNPTVPEHVVREAHEEDPSAAAAEWEAQFRVDLETLLDRDAVERCVVPGRSELPPRGERYVAFADPSGGKADSFTLAVAHREGDGAVVDCLRERRPPFSPDSVVGEYAALCRRYGLTQVTGDRYAGAWVEERFRAHGVRYQRSPLSKSDLYVALLGQVNSGRVELPDSAPLVTQLVSLERRTARATGRDTVDHPPGGHDDLANTVAGAVHAVLGKRAGAVVAYRGSPFSGFVPVLPEWWPEGWAPEWYEIGRSTWDGRAGA